MKRLGRRVGFALLAVFGLIVSALTLSWLVELRQSDAELGEEFKGQRIRPVVRRYTVADGAGGRRSIRFIETPGVAVSGALGANNEARPVVLFIHGAPSSLSFFNAFLKDTTLLNRAQLVAVDRPGYGYSDFGRVETSVVRQAELLQPLIDRYRNAPYLMLVGSSYGGSVSARLAMNNPNRVDHVVFVSSALGPGLERTYAVSYLADSPLIRWSVPTLLRLANDEKLAHRTALEAILPDWSKIKAGITMLHGQRDDLVYPTNVTFAQKRLVNAHVKQFILPESRHDIVFNKREYVTNILLNILDRRAVKATVRAKAMVVK